MGQNIQEWTRQNLWKTAFKKFEGITRPYPLKIFKGCLPQILQDLFLNTLYQLESCQISQMFDVLITPLLVLIIISFQFLVPIF